MKTIVGIGEILWDFLPSGKQLGGAPANFAYHAHGLGEEGIVVSCIGNDNLGNDILESLNAIGINHSFIAKDAGHKTGIVSVLLDENRVPQYTIHEDVAWDYLRETPRLQSLALKADVVCFGSLAQRSIVTRRSMHNFIRNTPRSVLRIFDINLRQHYYSEEILVSSLKIANALKLNEDELPIVAKMLNISGNNSVLFRELSEQFSLRLIALTRGSA